MLLWTLDLTTLSFMAFPAAPRALTALCDHIYLSVHLSSCLSAPLDYKVLEEICTPGAWCPLSFNKKWGNEWMKCIHFLPNAAPPHFSVFFKLMMPKAFPITLAGRHPLTKHHQSLSSYCVVSLSCGAVRHHRWGMNSNCFSQGGGPPGKREPPSNSLLPGVGGGVPGLLEVWLDSALGK